MERPSSPEPLSPFQELLMRAAAGSREAVGELLLKFVPCLRKLAGHRLPPHIRGKISPSDLVQDVIVTAMEKLPQFEGTTEESLRAWLCMTLLNKLAKWRHRFFAALRDVRHEMSLDAPAADEAAWQQLADPGLPPDEIAARNEMAEVIREALAQLEEEHQLILRLRSETNLSYKEIGEVLDCSAAAARSHYYRAVSCWKQSAGKLSVAGLREQSRSAAADSRCREPADSRRGVRNGSRHCACGGRVTGNHAARGARWSGDGSRMMC